MSESLIIKDLEKLKSEVENTSLAKIDTLKMSDSMKKNMRFIHTHYTGMKYGFPTYDVKGFKINWNTWSFFAFLFGPLYYLVKGMWRKAILILLLSILTFISLPIVEHYANIKLPEIIWSLIGILWYVYSSYNAYRDIYRKEILGEKFWW